MKKKTSDLNINFRNQLRYWKPLVSYSRISTVHILVVIFLSLVSGFSDFLSIALLQPIILIFSNQTITPDNLSEFQRNLLELFNNWNDDQKIIGILIILIFLQILREFSLYITEYFNLRIRNNFELDIRNKVYQTFLNQKIKNFKNTSSGEIYSNINSLPRAAAGFVFGIISFIPQTIIICIYLSLMILIDLNFTLIIFFISLSILFLMKLAYKYQAIYSKQMRISLENIASKGNEIINALPIIQNFGQQNRMRKSFNVAAKSYISASIKNQTINAGLGPLQRISTFLIIIFSIIIYWKLSNDSSKEIFSYIIIFLVIISKLSGPFATINLMRSGISQQTPFVVRLLNFFKENIDIKKNKTKISISNFKKIELKKVFFAYENKIVLKNINLKISNGEFIAIVGESGSGKTTLISLINGEYFPKNGEILIDKKNLNKVNPDDWRKMLAVVSQNNYLFNISLEDNIKFGRPNAKKEEIDDALNLSNSSFFVKQLQKKLKTMISEGGKNLSVGQIQRIAIARALLAKKPLLIFDEITSAQDIESENKIKSSLKKLKGKKTMIVVAHRLGLIRDADKIFVMDKGKLIESGSHNQLIAKKGIYNKLYKKYLLETNDAS